MSSVSRPFIRMELARIIKEAVPMSQGSVNKDDAVNFTKLAGLIVDLANVCETLSRE